MSLLTDEELTIVLEDMSVTLEKLRDVRMDDDEDIIKMSRFLIYLYRDCQDLLSIIENIKTLKTGH